MNHMSEETKAPQSLIVLTEAETTLLIKESSRERPLELMFGPGHVVIHPTSLRGGWARERITALRAQQPHRDTTCPSCDGDQYDDAAGFCEECGFEGFDGDQN